MSGHAVELRRTAEYLGSTLDILEKLPEPCNIMFQFALYIHKAAIYYFNKWSDAAFGSSTETPTVPTMRDDLRDIVEQEHWYKLPSIPTRYRISPAPSPAPSPGPPGPPGAPKSPPGVAREATTVINQNPNKDLLERYKKAGFTRIGELIAKRKAMPADTRPKMPYCPHGDVCLHWALRARCLSTCNRAASHIAHDNDTVGDVNRFLDALGVPLN